jgi:hypothetical protein
MNLERYESHQDPIVLTQAFLELRQALEQQLKKQQEERAFFQLSVIVPIRGEGAPASFQSV